jgi:hypothetical protein
MLRHPIGALLVSLLVACLALVPSRSVHAQAVVGAQTTLTVQQFMAELANYGVWRANTEWGWYWQPTGVGPGWRPYSAGQWVVSEGFGLYWQSSEPFGWAVYHYGRWMWVDSTGWVWIPDKQWGPGYVVWAYGEGYVAWAPMPPSGPGRQAIVRNPVDLPAWQWTIVPQAQLFASNAWQWAVPTARNANLMPHIPQHTAWRGDSDYSLPADMVAAICANPDPAQPVVFVMTPIGVSQGNQQGGINAYAPEIVGDAQPLADRFHLLPPQPAQPARPATPAVPAAPAVPPPNTARPPTVADARAQQQHLMNVYAAGEAMRLSLAQQMDAYNPPVSGWGAGNASAWAATEGTEYQQQMAREQGVMSNGGYGTSAYAWGTPPVGQAAP